VTAATSPLRHVAFRWLLAARTMALLGNAVAPVALAFAVLDLTGSVTDLGVVVAARSVTNVALLLMGGVLADRMSRRTLLVGASWVAGLTQAVVAALVLTGTATVTTLAVLSAFNGAAAALSFPASVALTPQTVPTNALVPANALLRLGITTATITGAAAGGVLVAAVGPGWGLALDAATFALSGLLFARLRVQQPSTDRSATTVLSDLRAGWSEFVARSWVWVVVLQFGVVNAAFVGSVTVLGPAVADTTIGRAGWGLVLAVQSAGLVAGALLALRWPAQRALRRGVGLTLLSALPPLALAGQAPVAVLAAAAFLAGVGIEQFTIAWDVSLQQHVPPQALARVYSYDAVGSFIAIPLGEVAVGPLAASIGTSTTLIGCAAVITAATLLALGNTNVRQLRTTHPPR
jgi:MFS family permease